LEKVCQDEIVKIDSIVLEQNGQCLFRVIPSETEILLLRFDNNDFIPLVVEKNDRISVVADADDIKTTFSVQGNKESFMLSQYFKRLFSDMKINDSLHEVLSKYQNTPYLSNTQEEINNRHHVLFDAHKAFAEDIIRSHPDCFSNILIVNQYIGGHRIFSLQEDTAVYFLIDRNLFEHYPENTHVVQFHERIAACKQEFAVQQLLMEKLQPGKHAPEFSLPDKNGKIINSIDFQGNIAVLMFWASWDRGTPQHLEMLKIMSQDYQNKQVIFVAISMDDDETQWKKAMQRQPSNWIQLSDLKGAYSPLIPLYNLQNDLPVYCIIDKNGDIMAQSPTMAEIDELLYQETHKENPLQ
jgi:peroxiredoxin